MDNGMKWTLLMAEILTVGSAIVVALHPNILYAAVFLLFSFMGVAVLFIFAGADFLAGVQIIVYVGGVTILILFAVMLTQWLYQLKFKDVRNKFLIPMVVLVGLIAFLPRLLSDLAKHILATPPENMEAFAKSAKTALIGDALLSTYILPFEAITILLLGALVGAVWLARPET